MALHGRSTPLFLVECVACGVAVRNTRYRQRHEDGALILDAECHGAKERRIITAFEQLEGETCGLHIKLFVQPPVLKDMCAYEAIEGGDG